MGRKLDVSPLSMSVLINSNLFMIYLCVYVYTYILYLFKIYRNPSVQKILFFDVLPEVCPIYVFIRLQFQLCFITSHSLYLFNILFFRKIVYNDPCLVMQPYCLYIYLTYYRVEQKTEGLFFQFLAIIIRDRVGFIPGWKCRFASNL